jgi:hypothetical protein
MTAGVVEGVVWFEVALVGFGLALGLTLRRWWTLAFACVPSLLWLGRWLPEWGEHVSDENTGADYFFFGFWYAGFPLIAAVAIGVGVGRRVFGRPVREPSNRGGTL